jgi:hypothetical protein
MLRRVLAGAERQFRPYDGQLRSHTRAIIICDVNPVLSAFTLNPG